VGEIREERGRKRGKNGEGEVGGEKEMEKKGSEPRYGERQTRRSSGTGESREQATTGSEVPE
jgi:hypothetical protein